MKSYINRHAGRRAFVIGNGPSLRDTDLHKLAGEVTFGSNRIYLYPFFPTYYAVVDSLVAQDNRREIMALGGMVKFLDMALRGLFPASFKPDHWVDVNRKWMNGEWDELGFWDGLNLYGGGTVTYTLLQLAFLMGCDPVYLVGVDHDYVIPPTAVSRDGVIYTSKGADPNHFDPGYFGEGKRFHHPRTERMERSYIRALEAYEEAGRRVYNATKGGKLEVFERVDYDSLF